MCKKLLFMISFVLVLGLSAGPANAQEDVNDVNDIVIPPSEVSIRVNSGNDDAEQHLDDGDIDLTSSDLELPYEDGGDPATDLQAIGLRFVDVPVSRGGPVDSAYVEFEIDELKTGSNAPVNLIIEGELVADAAAFENVAGNITDRPVTKAKVMWSVPADLEVNDNIQTPDISSVIQEIVDQNDWSPGNAIVLLIRDDPDNASTGLRAVESYDGESDAAPLLQMIAVIDPEATSPEPIDGAVGVSTAPGISTFISKDVPKNVPQAYGNIPKGVNSVLNVDDSVTIKDLNVELDIRMPGNNADLDVYLTSPDGKKVELFTDVGLENDDFRNTILDDEASKSIRNGSEPFTGIFKPEGRLRGYDGRDTAGNWILRIEDDWNKVAGAGNTATLNSWRIVVEHDISAVSWTPSDDPRVVSQDVYFSSVYDDVNGVGDPGLITSVSPDVDSVLVGALEEGTTYYWRVDVVIDDGTVFAGKVWSFTTATGNVTIDKRIAKDEDDSEEDLNPDKLGENDMNSSDLEMPYEDRGMVDPQIVGVRWRDIPLRADDTILDARVRFQVDENKDGTLPVNLVIEGELNPDPNAFIEAPAGTFDISSRPRTEANVLWSVPNWPTVGDQGPDQTTPDVTTVLEELISQDGWAPGNAIALIISDDPCNPSEGIRAAEAGPGDDSALLHISAITEVATNPSPADGIIDKVQETILSWTPGYSGVSRDVYFGTSSNPPKVERTTGTTWDLGKLAVSTTYYWRIDEYDADGTRHEGPVWSFTTVIGEATNPEPADGSEELALETTLSWTPGGTAVSSDVYFGIGDDLEFMGNQVESTFDPNGLKIGRPYSWRIDSIEADGTKHVGDVWTFSTIDVGKTSEPVPADGGSVDYIATVLSWAPGLTADSYDVYISENKDDVIAGADAAFGANVTDTEISVGLDGMPIPDGLAGKTLYWRVDAVEPDREWVHVGEVWSFTVPPFEAHEPSPADGAENVDPNATLGWTPGLGAILHEVYFGDDLDTVTDATGAAPIAVTTFDPGPLEPGKTYYWRVDELNAVFTTKGTVWSFTTEPPNLVDLAVSLNTEGDFAGTFDTLIAGVLAADPNVVEALTGEGPLTVFAPTDEAFAALDLTPESIVTLDQAFLTDVLLYHVTPGSLLAADVLAMTEIPMVAGGNLLQDAGVLTDNLGGTANIIVTDVKASNGVIHVIDAVVLPKAPPGS